MATAFQNLRFHIAEEGSEKRLAGLGRRSGMRGVGAETSSSFHSDEAAARYYLSSFLRADERPRLRGLSAPGKPPVVPDLRLTNSQEVPQTRTSVLRFEQTQSAIPIFGSLAVVELDRDRELISIDAEVAEIRGISPIANISPVDALTAIAKAAGVAPGTLDEVDSPQLTYYFVESPEAWHLAWHCRSVPAAPPDFVKAATDLSRQDQTRSKGHGLGKSPRTVRPRLDYLVDAHSGAILFYFSSTPMLDVPAKCKGVDEFTRAAEFHGRQVPAGGFEMWDPLRGIGTYDLNFADIDTGAFPTTPVANTSADFRQATAAVSAHFHATVVHRFYQSVLARDSVDDKGMDLVSAVNCTYAADEAPPVWHNAVWYDNRMLYGQTKNAAGQYESYSRYLDVIAHELTHGVTEHTSNLVYAGQSGALNESFSDIFGILIKNWHAERWTSVAAWDWEIGAGLGGGGLPLRDLSDPTRTGDPDHMNNILVTHADNGGVHTNSNIHNKAAYNVLTAKDGQGDFVFKPEEVALLYYLCLSRLNATANFAKARQVLLDVATTYYAGDVGERQAKTDAIKTAYDAVGIH